MKHKNIFLLIIATLVLAGCQPAKPAPKRSDAPQAPGAPSSQESQPLVSQEDLPIHRVVLYQNGVGYFERQGEIESDVITLRIRPDQINDILKSLTVLDLTAGGRAVSISLPVDKGTADRLDDLPEQIQNEGGLLTLLRTFRGANVTLKTQAGDQSGRVAGVESIPSTNKAGQQEPGWRVMLRRSSGALDIINVTDITGLRILDQTLELGMEKSLDVSLNEGSWKPIELKVRLDSAKKRTVRVSYITEMPVWKPAYRLVIDGSEKGIFQGWAVVDNVSGSSWEKISMSLVAGNPISFLYNLYEPQFVTRQDLSGRVKYSALAPPKVESAHGLSALQGLGMSPNTEGTMGGLKGFNANGDGSRAYAISQSGLGIGGGGGGGYGAGSGYAPPREEHKVDIESYENSFGDVAETRDLSSLHEYVISGKGGPGVTVPDRSSSLVNIVQTNSKAKEIALFQPQPGRSYNALNPYRAVEFHNSSDMPLEPGPISLYRARDGDATFIGESFLEKTEKGEQAFFTFALDPLIELATAENHNETLNQITRIKNGMVTSEVKRVTTVTYTLKNKNDEDLEAVISRPKRPEWTLSITENATLAEASQVNYVRVKIATKGEAEVTLIETRMSPRRMRLNSGQSLTMLDLMLAKEAVDPALKAALDDLMKKRAELMAINEELGTLYQRRGELQDDQRLNADLLESIKDIRNAEANKLKRQYSADMNKARTELVKTRADIALLENKRTIEQRLLSSLYDKITFGEE